MHCVYGVYLANFWLLLFENLNENYGNEESEETSIVLGEYVKCTLAELRHNNHIPKYIKKVIAYQSEPLVKTHWWQTERIVSMLRDYDEVWDYDLDNIKILKSHGIDAKFKPVKYSSRLKKIPTDRKKDIDVLFFGTQTPHRQKMVNDLLNAYKVSEQRDEQLIYCSMSFVWLNNIDDGRLDEFIARSKIVLNILANKQEDKTDRQPQTRIMYPLINGKCILSEKVNRNYFGNSIIEFDGSQDLGDKIVRLLKTGEWNNYPLDKSDYFKFINKQSIIGEISNV